MRAPMVASDGQTPQPQQQPCGAELVTTILGVVAQVVGTICIVGVVALVVGCSDPPADDGHDEEPLMALAVNSICYRFCEDSSRPSVSRRDDCPAGTTCRTTLPPGVASFDTCYASDKCQEISSQSVEPCGGYSLGQACVTDDNLAECRRLVDRGCPENRLVAMESCPLQFGCADPLPTMAGPSPPEPVAEDASTVSSVGAPPTTIGVSSTSSASESGGVCSWQRETDWVLTKVLGVMGGLLLGSATPFLSCQTQGCAGCGNSPQAHSAARKAWALFGLCVFGFVTCGTLGIGFHVEVPIGWAVILGLAFNGAFALMCIARCQSATSHAMAGPEGTPMIVVATTAIAEPSQVEPMAGMVDGKGGRDGTF